MPTLYLLPVDISFTLESALLSRVSSGVSKVQGPKSKVQGPKYKQKCVFYFQISCACLKLFEEKTTKFADWEIHKWFK